MKNDTLYIQHILDCIQAIETYTTDCDFEKFANTPIIQDACLRKLQILAESTQRISTPWKQQNPQIQWKKIAGFRNILTHDYFGTDLQLVWAVIQNELPTLKNHFQTAKK